MITLTKKQTTKKQKSPLGENCYIASITTNKNRT